MSRNTEAEADGKFGEKVWMGWEGSGMEGWVEYRVGGQLQRVVWRPTEPEMDDGDGARVIRRGRAVG